MSPVPHRARPILALAAIALMGFAALVLVWCDLHESEKPGKVYVMGHWCDLPWEVAVPSAALGVGLLAVLPWLRRRPRDPLAGA